MSIDSRRPIWHLSPTDVENVIIAVANGESIASICKRYRMNTGHFSKRLLKDALFRRRFDDAKKIAATVLADKLLEIADNCLTPTDAAAARIKAENMKWLASRYNKEQFGDNSNISITNTIDLAKVLAAARSRALPMLQNDSKLIDVNSENCSTNDDSTTGCKPVDNADSIDDLL
jgi:hypothetical protein